MVWLDELSALFQRKWLYDSVRLSAKSERWERLCLPRVHHEFSTKSRAGTSVVSHDPCIFLELYSKRDIQWRHHFCRDGESCIPFESWVILREMACRGGWAAVGWQAAFSCAERASIYLQSSQGCLWLRKDVNLLEFESLVDNYSLLLPPALPMPSRSGYETLFTDYKWMQCYVLNVERHLKIKWGRGWKAARQLLLLPTCSQSLSFLSCSAMESTFLLFPLKMTCSL